MINPDVAENAERHVLSAMMHGAAERAAQLLTPDDFADYRNALLYDHILELHFGEEPTTWLSVLHRIEKNGTIKRADTVVWLQGISELDVIPEQVGFYAGIVSEEADRRRLVKLGSQLASAGSIDDPEARAHIVDGLRDQLAGGDTTTAADTWTPVDLGPYLDGTVDRPEPTVGIARQDGLRVLYPGKEHSIIGEMEAGKSWFALACVAAELVAGHTVVYVHFEEDDPADTVERLRALGVPSYQIRSQFLFVGPHQAATSERIRRLTDRRPSLVILDGQNEGMALHAQAIREEDGAAEFRRLLVKPWTAVGAAVAACDHVVKDAEARGRYALGSVHKGNALNGSLIVLENAEPFGRGERGVSRVYVTKDRPGHLRRHGQKTKIPGKSYLGMLVVDDTRVRRDGLDLQWFPPADTTPDDAVSEKTNPGAAWIEKTLAAESEQSIGSKKQLLAALRNAGYSLRNTEVDEALEDLKYLGKIEEVRGARGALGYRIKASVPLPEGPATSSQDSLPGVG